MTGKKFVKRLLDPPEYDNRSFKEQNSMKELTMTLFFRSWDIFAGLPGKQMDINVT